jgi:hypothetical protein
MSVVVGPGFDLGSAGALTAFGGKVESLPALPVLAAIPVTLPSWGPALMLVPVALGVLAGRIRWGKDLPTPTGTAASGAGLAGVVAALVGGLVLMASGSLGGGRLDAVGPVLLPVVAASAGLVLLGFLAEAGFQSVRLSWELHQAERRAEERRLRRDARESTEPTEAEAAAGAPAVEGEVETVDVAAPRAVPRRQPRPVRESLVIPLVVAPAEQDPTVGGVPGAAPQLAASPGSDDDASDVTVDLTVDPGSDGDSEPAGRVADQRDTDHPAMDGDSTVDLCVDPADLAEIRTAWREGSPDQGSA